MTDQQIPADEIGGALRGALERLHREAVTTIEYVGRTTGYDVFRSLRLAAENADRVLAHRASTPGTGVWDKAGDHWLERTRNNGGEFPPCPGCDGEWNPLWPPVLQRRHPLDCPFANGVRTEDGS